MKIAQTQDVSQNLQQVKTRINDAVNGLNTTMQQVQEGVKQMQDLMKDVEQLDIQVKSLQQAKVQQQTVQPMQANDGFQTRKPAWWQGMWAKLQDAFGPEYTEEEAYNAVAGVRGSVKTDDLFISTAKKKKNKHLTHRDSGYNKDLPDFWRKNYDYGESPYTNLAKIDKITDEVPNGKRKKKS